jgi:MarR family transcriptional regulator, organic hydroperoxide resistance regulator
VPRQTQQRPNGQPPSAAETAAFDAAWDEFFGAIRRARSRFVREAGGLTLPQYHLLTALAERSPRTVGELAEHAAIAPPTATRMLDGLERAGMVERRQSAADRRAVEIELTSEGKRVVGRKRARIAAKRRALFESLAPGEREQAERLLLRLGDLIDEL